MNQNQNPLASATRRLAWATAAFVLPVALCAAAGEPAKVLVHRFTLAEVDEWESIELRPTATVWHRRWSGGPRRATRTFAPCWAR